MRYDYCCVSCENIQEEEHSMKESPKIKCNKCGKPCSKVITGGAGVVFKGPDWITNEGRQIVKTATGESIDMSKHDK